MDLSFALSINSSIHPFSQASESVKSVHHVSLSQRDPQNPSEAIA